MTNQSVFRAIADPTRREIIGLLSQRDLTLNNISAQFDMTRPAVAKHISVLKKSGLVAVRPQGRERIHSLQAEGLRAVADWVQVYSRFWDDKLANLKQAVEQHDD